MSVQTQWAMVIGGASCVYDDVAALEEMYGQPWDGLTIAVNDIGCHWPREIHHWVSLHTSKFRKWTELRRQLDVPQCKYVTWGQPVRFLHFPVYTDRVEVPWGGGSSGMFGAQVARMIGCTKVILCGIPMTDTRHFSESREEHGNRWARANDYWRAWVRHAALFQGWAKSMSGRTRELLGPPTPDWLLESSAPQDRLIL